MRTHRLSHRSAAVAMVAIAMVACALAAAGCGSPSPAPAPDLSTIAAAALSQIDGEIVLPGLRAEVEVIRDRWGVPHIYADNDDDLFFAQGFVAAQDRLWQLDMWRRWLEGSSAEVAGAERFEADRIQRLLSWRGGPTAEELTSYHPEAERILEAFVAGINAYIDHRGDDLPVEFVLTGTRPEKWTLETPTMRSTLTGVGGSLVADLRLARSVARVGAERANEGAPADPSYELVAPRGLDASLIDDAVIDAFSVRVGRDIAVPLLPEYAAIAEGPIASLDLRRAGITTPNTLLARVEWTSPDHRDEIGSNNWVIAGDLSASGKPMLANDPHRQVTNPSLRYLAHLDAPGWKVIGGGEPALPGIAIGHNERIAWGLTIVGTDQIDVFVEQLDPSDPSRVMFDGESVPLRVETESIAVRDEAPREVVFEFSRHGPILYKDVSRGVAYAVRSFAQEPGTAPYLGSLRVDQASDCVAFLDAMDYWKSPSENMICGDVDGNISWRASALTPNRSGPTPWYGRLPVPGTGEYEWDGFRDDLPEELNPERGWIATANHNIQPAGFHPPIMFKTGPPYARFDRVAELLTGGGSVDGKFSVEDFERLQHDAFSAPAARMVPWFRGWASDDEEVEWARATIAAWDGVFRRSSAAAALYMRWRRSMATGMEELTASDGRDSEAVERGLRLALEQLREELGPEVEEWRWGRLNEAGFSHSLTPAFDLPTAEKTGGAGTVYANGATFREVLDLADWDLGRATTAPGQSGQPGSPFYGDLISGWADGEYFPLAFSREAVEDVAAYRLVLMPARD